MAHSAFSASSLLARLLISLLLVFATYNPTGYSVCHWVVAAGSGPISLKLLAALSLAMIYYAIIRIVLAAFRLSGLIVAALVIILGFAEMSLLGKPPDSWRVYVVLAQYGVLLAIAMIMSVGVSWSALIERLTGQLQKRYVQR